MVVQDIPANVRDLFEKSTIAHLTTMDPDGTPHATPVWIDYDPDANQLLVNSERGRRKVRNVSGNTTVALSMTDPEDPHRYLAVKGSVTDIATTDAREHIDKLSQRYLGKPYRHPIKTERVILRIRPDEVLTRP